MYFHNQSNKFFQDIEVETKDSYFGEDLESVGESVATLDGVKVWYVNGEAALNIIESIFS